MNPMTPIWRQLTILVVTVWLATFTFYAAIVVPIGTQVVGSTHQGFITQTVAIWINALSLTLTTALVADLWRRRSLVRVTIVSGIGITTLALMLLHGVMSGYLQAPTKTVLSPSEFYQWHRIYLIASAIEWVAALLALSLLVGESVTSKDQAN